MKIPFLNIELDIEKLFAAAMKVVSYDTVDELRSFADLVKKAAELVVQAAERINAEESGEDVEASRDMNDPVTRIVAEYRK